MDALRFIHSKLGSDNARRTYVKLVSLFCRLLSIQSLKGTIVNMPIYVSSQDNWGLRKFYFRNNYNIEHIEMLKNILMSNDNFVFWDIGANYGAYSLLLSPYATCTVSVEPSSRTFHHLSRSCKEAKTEVILENCAIADSSGSGTLYLASGFSGDDRIYKPVEEDRRDNEVVAIKTIDEIVKCHFKAIPENNLMKIDVQGAECLVLRGAKHLIGNSRMVFIFLEIWPKGLMEIGTSLDDLIDICNTYGLVLIDKSGKPYEWDSVISEFNRVGSTMSNVLLTRYT